MTSSVVAGAAEANADSASSETMAPTQMRLIRLPEVIARVGIKRSTIYQRMAEGRFPKGRSIGPKSTVWVESEINDWIKAVIS